MKKDVAWKWSKACEEAFQKLKELLTSAKVLCHYDVKMPLTLSCDASSHGIGMVISHVLPNGEERPIAYASRTLSKSEKNYAQIEKEALAIVFGIKRFHQFLYGRQFCLITDHKPLVTIFGPQSGIPPIAAACLQRWALILSSYRYTIQYKRTQEHGNADGLSRLPTAEEEHEDSSQGEAGLFNLRQINVLPVTVKDLVRETGKDSLLSQVKKHVLSGETPSDLFIGRKLRTRFELLKPNVQEVVLDRQDRQRKYQGRRQDGISLERIRYGCETIGLANLGYLKR